MQRRDVLSSAFGGVVSLILPRRVAAASRDRAMAWGDAFTEGPTGCLKQSVCRWIYERIPLTKRGWRRSWGGSTSCTGAIQSRFWWREDEHARKVRWEGLLAANHLFYDLRTREIGMPLDTIAARIAELPGKVELVANDLGAVAAPESAALVAELRVVFAEAVVRLQDRLSRVRAARELVLGRDRVLKIGDEDFVLLCSVCGKAAVHIGEYGGTIEVTRMLSELMPSLSVGRAQSAELFAALHAGGVKALHKLLERRGQPGVDGFCPKCRRLYCDQHFQVRSEWSGSWFVGATGKCPKGHSRELA